MKMRLILFLIAAFLGACNYNKLKDGAAEDGRPKMNAQDGPAALDYQSVLTAVIGPRCLGCHSAAGGNQGGVSIESYAQVKARLRRVVYRALDKRDMPAGGLSPAEARLLQAWVDAGAPEQAVPGGEIAGKPDPDLEQGPTNWDKVRDKIFAAKCLDCHNAANPAGALDLGALPLVRAKATIIFDRVILRQDMPMSPYPPLSEKERFVLLQWFDKGMPE